jgi:hypothetical protein
MLPKIRKKRRVRYKFYCKKGLLSCDTLANVHAFWNKGENLEKYPLSAWKYRVWAGWVCNFSEKFLRPMYQKPLPGHNCAPCVVQMNNV